MGSRDDLARQARAAILSMVERVSVQEGVPEDGALTLADDGERRMQAKLKDGRWVRPNGTELSIVPTHWMRFKL